MTKKIVPEPYRLTLPPPTGDLPEPLEVGEGEKRPFDIELNDGYGRWYSPIGFYYGWIDKHPPELRKEARDLLAAARLYGRALRAYLAARRALKTGTDQQQENIQRKAKTGI